MPRRHPDSLAEIWAEVVPASEGIGLKLAVKELRALRHERHRQAAGLPTIEHMAIKRMEHVGIVVDDLAAAIEFFVELGLEPGGQRPGRGQLGGPNHRARRN